MLIQFIMKSLLTGQPVNKCRIETTKTRMRVAIIIDKDIERLLQIPYKIVKLGINNSNVMCTSHS